MNAVEKSQTPARPWWRFGHVWMVMGGPAVVVLASLFTYYLAVRSPDPVLPSPTESHQVGAQQGDDISQAPAMQARNHAATGVLPTSAKTKP